MRAQQEAFVKAMTGRWARQHRAAAPGRREAMTRTISKRSANSLPSCRTSCRSSTSSARWSSAAAGSPSGASRCSWPRPTRLDLGRRAAARGEPVGGQPAAHQSRRAPAGPRSCSATRGRSADPGGRDHPPPRAGDPQRGGAGAGRAGHVAPGADAVPAGHDRGFRGRRDAAAAHAHGVELTGCQFLLETGASHRLYDQLDARALDIIVSAELGDGADWMEVHPLLRGVRRRRRARRGATAGRDVLRQLQAAAAGAVHAAPLHGAAHRRASGAPELALPYRFELGQLSRDPGAGRAGHGLDDPDAAGADAGAAIPGPGRSSSNCRSSRSRARLSLTARRGASAICRPRSAGVFGRSSK